MTTPPESTTGEYVSLASYKQLMARYERLMTITWQLNSTLDLAALLKGISQAAVELTNTEESSILLLDPASGELRFEAASNLTGGEMAAIPVPIEGSIAGWVVTHGEPVLVEDTRNDARWFANVDKTTKFVTRSLLAVPLKFQNRSIGVIEAINKREDQPWTQDDVDTLLALGNQAAIAVQNARLFQQSDFIAEMVHELRTPLAALKASTALLRRFSLPEQRREEIILTIQQETDRLSKMTTEFLDLARLESRRTRLERVPFLFRSLVEECVNVVADQAAERAIQISIEGDDYVTEADRDKIKQVLLNLLTNAIKYNREQGTIVCSSEPYQTNDPATPPTLLVSMSDTGYGISPENQQRVFDKFFRAVDSAGYTQGTGLGLAIAQRVVQAHGCDMWLQSELGVGTTFYFTLPLAQEHPADQRPHGSAELVE